LTELDLSENELTNLTLPAGLTSLTTLNLGGNRLTSLTLPADLTNLTMLYLGGNQLTGLTLPAGLASLTTLDLSFNQLANFSFLSGLRNLKTLYLGGNQLTSLTLPEGLTSLTYLGLGSRLTRLTLPADMTNLTMIGFEILLGADSIPLDTLVLSEQLASTALADQVANLKRRGVSVYAYPLEVSLVSGQPTMAGAFEFTLTGPPGAYTILGSSDLATWSELGTLTNELGTAVFNDLTVTNSSQNFYRARTAP